MRAALTRAGSVRLSVLLLLLLLLLLLALDETCDEVLLLKLEGLELALDVHLLGHELLTRLLVESKLGLVEPRCIRLTQRSHRRRLGAGSRKGLVCAGVADGSELLKLNLLSKESLLLSVAKSGDLGLDLGDLVLLLLLLVVREREAALRTYEPSAGSRSSPAEAGHRADRARSTRSVR